MFDGVVLGGSEFRYVRIPLLQNSAMYGFVTILPILFAMFLEF